MKRTRLRSGLLTALCLSLVAAAWWFLAPTRIGGSTTYVATHGISMEPRFHTGDLAIVRSAGSYRVGDVVAYHSDLLHTTVLHRIYARHGSLYAFKGDNNDFIDPRLIPRADLIGKLWLRVPHGGVLLATLHTPIGAALLCALVGLFVTVGVHDRRRRRRRRRAGASGSGGQGAQRVSRVAESLVPRPITVGALLIGSATAAVLFLALGLMAFTRPADKIGAVSTTYTQQVRFGYSARTRSGPVYPTGRIATGDPIFLTLVRRLRVHIAYSFTSPAQHEIVGTESVALQVTAQDGWSHRIVLVPPTRFRGDDTSTDVTLDLPQLGALLAKVGSLTGMSNTAGYTISVDPRVQISGEVQGHTVETDFGPALGFQLGPAQLVSEGASSTAAAAAGGSSGGAGAGGSLTPSQSGTVGAATSTPSRLGLLGISIEVAIVRWLSLVGLVASGGVLLYALLRKRAEPFQETAHIQAKYGHMIVPIVGGEDLGWPPVDVPNIKALVMLAESGQRLILHSRANELDTYMVNDEGTVYRYQVKPSKVVWGEWSQTPAPVKAAA